jgi:hypothetical protein
MGILKPQAKLAGASSGALITASYCSGLGPAEIIGAGYALVSCLSAARAAAAPTICQQQRLLQRLMYTCYPLVHCEHQHIDMQQHGHDYTVPGMQFNEM